MYLVESVTIGDKDEVEEKESLFVILKKPYLIEKDPVTGDVSYQITLITTRTISAN